MTNAEQIVRLKKAVNVARQRAREAETKYDDLHERCQPYIRELGKWRTALGFLKKHSDKDGQKVIGMMAGWYTGFILGPIDEEIEGHPPSGMCARCPYHS